MKSTITIFRVHHSFKKNGDFKYNPVKQICPIKPNLMLLSNKDYGRSFADKWPNNFTVEPISKSKKVGDLLRVNPLLIISKKAYSALDKFLKGNCELLNVQCKNIDGLIACNITTCLDVLNKNNCVFRFLGEGESKHPVRTLSFDFIKERISSPIFRIKEDQGLFVTDEFVETVRLSNITGFGFHKLWNSEVGRLHSEISINNLFLSEDEDYNW